MVKQLRAEVTDYSSRVLGIIKEKFGLKDKGEALNKFIDLYGEEFLEKEVKDEIIEEVILSCREHIEKYGNRKMTIKELD